ncbi:hypothetical protein [Photobacterium damselae]|uniref:hypothetical protein n=1 Tax=Photobacterium damselae TaxID=38293 RepID=UPI001F3B0F03|nr:hypothetical protein [Photobacterium damselae]UKA04992.1 hypothetical protein IHC89_22360 [Photobacterium damselae subsp. damselae]
MSVSECPEDWKRICKLGGLPTWKLSRPNSRYADFYSCDKQDLINWGLENKLITLHQGIAIDLLDEDEIILGQQIFLEETEFLREYDEEDLKKSRIVQISKATHVLCDELPNFKFDPINPLEMLFFVFVKGQQSFDGIWYNHINDGRYSAPCGIIFDAELTNWTATSKI